MGHLASAYLAAKTGIKLTHVPFRGSAPALTAVMGGHVQVLLDPPFTAMPAIELGSTRALAVTGAWWSPLLPNVPTVAELGFPGFAAGHWGGFFRPRRHTAGRDFRSSMPGLSRRCRIQKSARCFAVKGLEIINIFLTSSAKKSTDHIELWSKVIRDLGIKPE